MAGILDARRPAARLLTHALSIGAALVLAGCSSLAPQAVSPTLNAASVSSTVRAHADLMTALEADARVMSSGEPNWYDVSLAGFNYVDDQCAVYFDSLFKFSRNAKAVGSGLDAFNQTSAAIMQITGTADITMAVVAQAFGLAGRMTDVVAGTFLYELPPANTQRFVQKNMATYRGAVSENRSSLDSPAAAYSSIRGYLDLCLPVTIEGQLLDRIGDSAPKSKVDGTGTNVQIDVRPSASVLPNASTPLPPVVDPSRPPSPQGINRTEQYIVSSDWKKFQRLLCIAEDGVPGATTHDALVAYFGGLGLSTAKEIPARGINAQEHSLLREAVLRTGGRTCLDRNVADASASATAP
jgi:hypothetical protein